MDPSGRLLWDDLNPLQRVTVFDRGVDLVPAQDAGAEDREKAFVSYRTGDLVSPALSDREALASMVEEFADCIRTGRASLTDGRSGLRVLDILEAASRSIALHGTPGDAAGKPAGPGRVVGPRTSWPGKRRMSRIDVVIPCYNYGRFLSECVSGALDDQPGSDVRVLIIDDASQDDSAETARKLAAADDRIEVRVHPVNRGHIATYNEGLLDWADGNYCVLISADDRLAPGALRRAADLMDAHPEVGFVYGHAVEFRDGEKLSAARTRCRSQTIWPGHRWLERRFREARNCIFSPEVVVRTSLQHQLGGYDPEPVPHGGPRDVDAAGGSCRRRIHPR